MMLPRGQSQTYIVSINRWSSFFRVPEVSMAFVSHNVYGLSNGLEWEINISRKPAVNRIAFQIQTENLTFHYQPPLDEDDLNFSRYSYVNETHAMIDQDVKIYRPENVVGSYAVYHSFLRDNEYRTGKVFHIYRPFAYDLNNYSTWLDLNITGNVFTLSISQAYLDAAVYPICIDPSFGYDSAGGTSYDIDIDEKLGAQYQITEAGTVHNVTVNMYVDEEAADYYGCFYHGDGGYDPGALNTSVLRSDLTTGDYLWHTFDTTDFDVSANEYFWLTVLSTTYTEVRYDTASTYYAAHDTSDSPPPDNPFGSYASNWTNRHFSFFANYSVAAAPGWVNVTLYENLLIASSLRALRALSWSQGQVLHFYPSLEALRSRFFSLSETVIIFSDLSPLRALSSVISESVLIYVNLEAERALLGVFAEVYGTVMIHSNMTASRELIGLFTELLGTVRIYSNMTGLRELLVEVSETLPGSLRIHANMTALREILVEVTEILGQIVRIHDALITETAIILTVNMVLALAALALIIALAAFAYAATQRG